MRWLVLLCALTGIRVGSDAASDLQKINEFNQLMQLRFQTFALAQRAMKSFADGGKGFETSMGTWNISVRPVVASQDPMRCLHNSNAYSAGGAVTIHQTLGGVMYAYRRKPA